MNWPGKALIVVFLLLGVAEASAQSTEYIPFDYFYGRIIGRQHIAVNYNEVKWGPAVYDFNYTVGFGDRAWLELPDIVIWKPNADFNSTNWTNPTIAGGIQLSPSTRYGASADYVDNDLSNINEVWPEVRSENSVTVSQSIWHLEGGRVRLTPRNSLCQYLEGAFLEKGQFSIVGTGQVSIAKSAASSTRLNFEPQWNRSQGETHSDNYRLNMEIQAGLISNLNLKMRGQFSNSPIESKSYVSTMRVLEDNSERVQWHYADREDGNTSILVAPRIIWMPLRTLWVSGEYQYQNIDSDHDELRSDEDSMGPYSSTSQWESESHHDIMSYGARFTWINKSQDVSADQLLDNFQGYYGDELATRTLVLNAEFGYLRDFHRYQDWIEGRQGTDNRDRDRSFSTKINARYYFKRSMSVACGGHLTSSLSSPSPFAEGGQRHSQRYWFDAEFAYASYHWDAQRRRDISWNGISDIDYLLGALLRKGDSRARVKIQTPPSVYSQKNYDKNFWKFYNGDFSDDWKITIDAAWGLLNSLELGATRSYEPSTIAYTDGELTSDATVAKTYMKFQPIGWLRLGGNVITTRTTDKYRIGGVVVSESKSRDWKAGVSVDCVF